jgi:hypothetical protein
MPVLRDDAGMRIPDKAATGTSPEMVKLSEAIHGNPAVIGIFYRCEKRMTWHIISSLFHRQQRGAVLTHLSSQEDSLFLKFRTFFPKKHPPPIPGIPVAGEGKDNFSGMSQ